MNTQHDPSGTKRHRAATAPGWSLRRAGKVLLILGLVVFVPSAAIGTHRAVDLHAKMAVVESEGVPFTTSTQLDLAGGQAVGLYRPESGSMAICDIVDPQGQDVDVVHASGVTVGDWSLEFSFTAQHAGTYSMSCGDGDSMLIASPLTPAFVALSWMVIVLSIVFAACGVLLAVLGLTLGLVGRRKAVGPTAGG